MKTVLQDEIIAKRKISSFARKSYQIYQEHFRSRNLKPALSQEEFFENYRT